MNTHYRLSFKWVMGSQYFLYFGVMGIFLPYFNLYCFHLGFSGFQIGMLSAVRSLAMVLFPVLWGIMADRFQARRFIYILCNIAGTGIWSFYLFSVEFEIILLITAVYGIFYSPVISFMEAFTMDVLGREKNSYGRIRAWGTIAFIMIVTITGKLIDRYSINIIIWGILAGSLLQTLFSFKIPDIKIVKKEIFNPGTEFLKNRRLSVFLFSAFLMLVSHGTYYGFFSIHLESLGFGNTFIGFAWALASVAEIGVMINSKKIFKRFSIENTLFFSFLIAGLRWMIMFKAESPFIILGCQLLHALTYGTFHIASILYIDGMTPNESKTLGQAVNNALTYGLGMMVGFFFSGWLYESIGAFNLFFISSLIALFGGILLKAVHMRAG